MAGELSPQERKQLHAIQARLWTEDPVFYRRIDQGWLADDERRRRVAGNEPGGTGATAGRRFRHSVWRQSAWWAALILVALGTLLMAVMARR